MTSDHTTITAPLFCYLRQYTLPFWVYLFYLCFCAQSTLQNQFIQLIALLHVCSNLSNKTGKSLINYVIYTVHSNVHNKITMMLKIKSPSMHWLFRKRSIVIKLTYGVTKIIFTNLATYINASAVAKCKYINETRCNFCIISITRCTMLKLYKIQKSLTTVS